MNSRATAAHVLQRVIYMGESLTEVLLSPAAKNLMPQDQGWLRDVSFGALRWHERLSAILVQLLQKPLKAADKDIECLLRVGLYQLIYQRTPEHAAVNETVKATKALRKQWAEKLVNGVLRRFLREKTELLAQADTIPSARYSFPQWLIQKIQTAYPEHWEHILDASNQHAPMTLRVNVRQHTTADYMAQLSAAEIDTHPNPFAPSALNLNKAVGIEALPAFKNGAVSIQDAAAQLAAPLVDCQPNMRVLDACAAPGGKTCHLLEHTPDLTVIALDSSENRLIRVHENLQRLKLKASVIAADAGDLETWWDGTPFDRILLDAPCSAMGVIRRHPDIKLLRRPQDIAALQTQQQRLLQNLWKTLKPNGKLVYATCSILPDENHHQIEAFLKLQQDAVHLPIEETWGHAMPYGRQILPQEHGMDGFYYAVLQKQCGA